MSNRRSTSRAVHVLLWAISFLFAAASFAAGMSPDSEVVYKHTPEGDLHLLMWDGAQPRAPKPPRGALLLLHGGGWSSGNPRQFAALCKQLSEQGLLAISVEYRLAKRKQYIDLEHSVEDARSAVRWVRQHAAELGVAPDKIAPGGGSVA